jgi:Protein of unknown function (DUF3489)
MVPPWRYVRKTQSAHFSGAGAQGLEFVRSGKGLAGIHAAADSYHSSGGDRGRGRAGTRGDGRNIAVKRIWQAIQKLALATEAATVAPQGADGAPSANASTNSTTPQPRRRKAPKAAKKSKASAAAKGGKQKQKNASHTGARQGSKKAEILALIERPQGATLAEIMKVTGWQAHSVRGFVSGTLGKNMSLAVESAKREDGQRVYLWVPKTPKCVLDGGAAAEKRQWRQSRRVR